jgi:hypothetical protein
MSNDETGDRRFITSFGLAKLGLPELQMQGVAANHCRAARFLMSVVARRLAEHAAGLPPSKEPMEDRVAGVKLTLSRNDVLRASKPDRFGHVNRDGAAQSVTVRLEIEEFGDQANDVGNALGILSVLFKTQRAPKLLALRHPEPSDTGHPERSEGSAAVDAFTADEWLRMSCERLGLDVPSAKPLSAFRESMDDANRRAIDDLPAFRARLSGGLEDGQVPMIKTGLDTAAGVKEYVWVHVVAWKDDEFVGILAAEPRNCPGYTKGQLMHVADSDVFDRAIFGATEAVERPLTDVVAMDFGMDLRA